MAAAARVERAIARRAVLLPTLSGLARLRNRPYQTKGNHAYRGRHSVVADGRIALRAAVAASLAGRVAGEGHAVAVLDGAPVVDPVVGAANVAGMALVRVTAVPVRLVSRGREECALVLSQTFESVIRVRAEP